jgi:hypothetical protein
MSWIDFGCSVFVADGIALAIALGSVVGVSIVLASAELACLTVGDDGRRAFWRVPGQETKTEKPKKQKRK